MGLNKSTKASNRKGEVFAYVGSIQNLKDLKAEGVVRVVRFPVMA